MNPQQVQSYNDSLHYCSKLISQLEQEKDTIRRCFHGEPLQKYLEATDLAIQRIKQLRNMLHNLQTMQP